MRKNRRLHAILVSKWSFSRLGHPLNWLVSSARCSTSQHKSTNTHPSFLLLLVVKFQPRVWQWIIDGGMGWMIPLGAWFGEYQEFSNEYWNMKFERRERDSHTAKDQRPVWISNASLARIHSHTHHALFLLLHHSLSFCFLYFILSPSNPAWCCVAMQCFWEEISCCQWFKTSRSGCLWLLCSQYLQMHNRRVYLICLVHTVCKAVKQCICSSLFVSVWDKVKRVIKA